MGVHDLWGTGSPPGYLSDVPWKRGNKTKSTFQGRGISLGGSLEQGGTGVPCGMEVSLKVWGPFWGGGPSCGSEVGTGSPQLERGSPRGALGWKGAAPPWKGGYPGGFGVPCGG